MSGWTSPAAERFRGFKPKTREELAARYQELFVEAGQKWQEFKKSVPAEPREKAPRNAVKRDEGLPDAVLEAFHRGGWRGRREPDVRQAGWPGAWSASRGGPTP